ncbi:acyl carrier protein [Lactobacillus acetotolerans]|uniref:Acyl carrier protein n=1 Tax=Lactobacillus acetotolerans TaxID=1600 RepID=A0A0D6A396_9LACO|nr:acyl carrier protein [Lactobacillus acetotolerans]BAQ57000.1 acyl carrier protein [Lactobacillus acetotolerans]
MTKEEVFNKVKDIIVDQLDVDADKIKEDTNFKEDLDLDSLDIFEVVDKLEDTYDIEIDTDTDVSTVSQLVDYVLKQINAKNKKDDKDKNR